MPDKLIFLPFLAMMTLTIFMMLIMVFRRAGDARKYGLSIGQRPSNRAAQANFKEGPLWSARTQASNDHVLNLFETPMFFYALCLALFVTNTVTDFSIWTATAYFLCRVVHSFIHVTYNHVAHRFFFFLLSLICLVLLIGQLLIAIHT